MTSKEFNQALREAGIDIKNLKTRSVKEQVKLIKSEAPILYSRIVAEAKKDGLLDKELTLDEEVEKFVGKTRKTRGDVHEYSAHGLQQRKQKRQKPGLSDVDQFVLDLRS